VSERTVSGDEDNSDAADDTLREPAEQPLAPSTRFRRAADTKSTIESLHEDDKAAHHRSRESGRDADRRRTVLETREAHGTANLLISLISVDMIFL
jgi:hypothetical protein